MGYSERKKEKIDELVKNKKEADERLLHATTDLNVKQIAFDTISAQLISHKTDLDNVTNDREASQLASHDIKKLEADVKESLRKADILQEEMKKMVKWTHLTATKTTSLALKIDEVNTSIIKESNQKNSVLSSWLIKDSAQAVVNGKAAVTATAKALVDSITAQGSTISLGNSLLDTKELIAKAIPLINKEKNSLDEQLNKLYETSKTKFKESLVSKKEKERELHNAKLEFDKWTIDAAAKKEALDAAILAVAPL